MCVCVCVCVCVCECECVCVRHLCKQSLKSLVVVRFVCRGEFLTQFSSHRKLECDGSQKGDNSIALEHIRRNSACRSLALTRVQSIRVSAEERSSKHGA